MALSTDVKLPRDRRPEWPPGCVGCGSAGTEPLPLSTRGASIMANLLSSRGKKVSLEVPACPACARRIRRRDRLEAWGMPLTILAGAFAGQFLLAPRLEGFWAPASVVACALVAYAPLVLGRIFWAPVFAISADDDSIDYEFVSEDHAREFAALNDGTAL